MIESISAGTTTNVAPVSQQTATPAIRPSAAAPKEDSVHLSAQVQAAASGDVDHDGDSH